MSDPSEQPKRRRRQPAPPPPPAAGSVAKGGVLVIVALVIGFVLLRDDDAAVTEVAVGADNGAVVDDDGTAVTPEEVEPDTTTPTTVALRPPSEVKVLVANGSGTAGAAGAQTDALQALGYVTGTPANAPRVPATVVYYTVGYEAEAQVLAESLGLGPNAVMPLPTPAPVNDMEMSNILVVVGPDLTGG